MRFGRGGGSNPSDSDAVDLRELFRMLWRRKWIMIACMVIGTVLSAVMVSQVPPVYTSVAKIMLDPRKSRVIADDAVVAELDLSEQVVNSEVSVLKSNVLVERVIREIGFERLEAMDPANAPPSLADRAKEQIKALVADFRPEPAPEGPALMTPEEARMERLIWAVRRNLAVYREGESYVIGIRVENESPLLAMQLANKLVDEYIAQQLDGRRNTAEQATAWIEQRVEELRDEVEVDEAAVAEYRANSLMMEGGSLDTASLQLAEINNQLMLARADRVAAEARYSQITSTIADDGITAVGNIVTSPVLETLNEERLGLMRRDALWADRYGVNHPERERLANELERVDADIEREVRKIVDQRRSELEIARIRENTMKESLDTLEGRVIEFSRNSIGLNQLERRAAASRQTYEQFLSRLTETRTQEQLQTPDAKLIERAKIPGSPSAPRPKLMTAMGGVAGLGLGIGLVLFLELTSITFRSVGQLERETGLPVLASIPRGNLRTPLSAYKHLLKAPYGIFAERIRHLRTALLMRGKCVQRPSILVISSVPGEGKTTTTVALAQMSVMAGKSVIVVDCDLRRSAMQQAFGWTFKHDLTDFMADRCSLSEAIHSDPEIGFDVLAASSANPLAADQLSAEWLQLTIKQLKKAYDVVLVDAPALLAVSDALVLAQAVDTTVYLVRWDSTRRGDVERGLSALSEMGIKVDGVVMTMIDPKESAAAYAKEYVYNV
nr:polysaccharide biosynthesis tyrosine autokinase [Rhodovulum robiginosum]